MKYEPTAVDHTVGLDDSVLQSPPILSLWIWLEVNLTCFINVLWPGASIDDPVRHLVLWRINVAVANAGKDRIVLLIRSIEIGHGLVALVEEDIRAAKSLLGKTTNVLIHTNLGSRQEPKNSLDHEIGDEPSQSALRDCSVNVDCLEEGCDETVNGKTSTKCLAKDLESAELLGNERKSVRKHIVTDSALALMDS